MPTTDIDGRDRYVDWYNAYKINEGYDGGETYGEPPYWGKYVFHDNNRDINYGVDTLRTYLKWYLEWVPPIWHDLHEAQTLLYTYSGGAPQNANWDPILYSDLMFFANYEVSRMTGYGMPGVWHFGFMDAWSPGYLAIAAQNHNGMLRMYEIFNQQGANTKKAHFQGAPTTRQWFRPNPVAAGDVDWSIRNSINYSETAVLTALELTSRVPSMVVENYYKKSLNAVSRGFESGAVRLHHSGWPGRPDEGRPRGEPAAPAGHRSAPRDGGDHGQGGDVSRRLVHREDEPAVRAAGEDAAREAGLPRPGAHHLRRQRLDDGPREQRRSEDDRRQGRSCDARGGSADGGRRDARVGRRRSRGPAGRRAGRQAQRRAESHHAALSTRERRGQGRRRPRSRWGTQEFPAGSLLVPSSDRARSEIEKLGLVASALPTAPDVETVDVDLPRVAIFTTWSNTEKVGWVRLAFDRFEIPFDLIHKDHVKQGNLRSKYDVIVMPHQGNGAKSIVYELPKLSKPLPVQEERTVQELRVLHRDRRCAWRDGHRRCRGVPAVRGRGRPARHDGHREQLSGGVRPGEGRGQRSRRRPVSTRRDRTCRAACLMPSHPVMFGYTQKTLPVRYAGGPLLQAGPPPDSTAPAPYTPYKPQVIARFTGGDASVLSGVMRGADQIRNRPMIVDAPSGKGHVLLFANNPIYRWQTFGEHEMVFNALLFWNDLSTIDDLAN